MTPYPAFLSISLLSQFLITTFLLQHSSNLSAFFFQPRIFSTLSVKILFILQDAYLSISCCFLMWLLAAHKLISGKAFNCVHISFSVPKYRRYLANWSNCVNHDFIHVFLPLLNRCTKYVTFPTLFLATGIQ